ncbi:hypothetical protein LZ30DRAFT_83951 [Colletotrichum cereale]|nr:hypothetical protein LZ30DRAFT_83951 [Colletotrichum cereale]
MQLPNCPERWDPHSRSSFIRTWMIKLRSCHCSVERPPQAPRVLHTILAPNFHLTRITHSLSRLSSALTFCSYLLQSCHPCLPEIPSQGQEAPPHSRQCNTCRCHTIEESALHVCTAVPCSELLFPRSVSLCLFLPFPSLPFFLSLALRSTLAILIFSALPLSMSTQGQASTHLRERPHLMSDAAQPMKGSSDHQSFVRQPIFVDLFPSSNTTGQQASLRAEL